MRPTTRIIGSLVFATCLLASCNKAGPGTHAASITAKSGDDNVVNLYTWADYIAPDTLESFEKVTGVKVRVAMIETNGTLETRMLTGNSGYDLVVPAAPYFQRQIRSGAYLPLDKTKLPNLTNLDPAIMAQVSLIDPGNAHGIVYAWGTYGLGYNEKKMSEVLPGVPVTSWRLLFDPTYASKLARQADPDSSPLMSRPTGELHYNIRNPLHDPKISRRRACRLSLDYLVGWTPWSASCATGNSISPKSADCPSGKRSST